VATRKAKSPLHEFAFIRALASRYTHRAPGLIHGIGDDAAVIAPSPKTWWHVTTDLLAEGVHFDLRSASLESVGYRAAMANLSDSAAMGALPRFLLTSIAIPKTFQRTQLHDLYKGLMKACKKHRVTLIGGDTSASRGGLFLSITLLGTTKEKRALFRHGAKVGDGIYVTGTLGDSLAGLRLLRKPASPTTGKSVTGISKAAQQFLINRHLHPTARVAEGQWLNNGNLATAAIDLSDGLSGDLRHLCENSRAGAEIELDRLPISPACRTYATLMGMPPIELALTGGEDYELLFTVPASQQKRLEQQAHTRGYCMTRIGTVRPRQFGIQMTSDGRTQPMPMTSYEHFR